MPRPCPVLFGAVLGVLLLTWPAVGDDSTGDEQILKAAGLATDGPALLDFFRKQTPSAATLRKAQELIRQLGDDDFGAREKAAADLVALGPVVLPLLRPALESADLEVRRRAGDCQEQIKTTFAPEVASAAARLLAVRRPAGTAEGLLAFLPGPYDDTVLEEVQSALAAIVRADRTQAPVLAAALTDAVPARRVAAAVALSRAGGAEVRPALRKLLQDADAQVRLPVARALALGGEREAVPVLIELLGQAATEQTWQVEELLQRLAGADAPAFSGTDQAGRQKSLDAWRTWWRQHGARADLTRLQGMETPLGYLLIVRLDTGQVVELDRAGKQRWQIGGLSSPLDAQVLPGGRALIAETGTPQRVTERNLEGVILWEQKVPEAAIHAQRLPGGTTFIATRRQLLEVDRAGKEVVRLRTANDLITARRFPDGRIGCVLDGSAYIELDTNNKEIKRFAIDNASTTNSLTLLPNGHVLIVSYGVGTIHEYDPAGKSVWETKMSRPMCAVRLPGGNTLVSSQDNIVVEFDRTGKEVSRRPAEGHPCQIRMR